MAVTYTGSTSAVNKSPIWESKTDHDIQEHLNGDRYTPVIQLSRSAGGRVAPYLPFLSDGYIKEYSTFAVMRRYKLVTFDEQGFFVPANAILRVADTYADTTGEKGTVDTYYDARPLVYAARDYGSGIYGDVSVDNPPKNLNPWDGEFLAAGDVNAQGCVTSGAASTDAQAGGIAARRFVGVTAQRFPIGVVTDKILSGAGRFQYREFDPMESLTVLTGGRVLLVTEQAVNRYNYGQATRKAIVNRNLLVGSASALALTSIQLDEIPYWANQGDATMPTADTPGTANATPNDMIMSGDLVACDDAGNFVRFDVRVDDWVDAADNAGADTDIKDTDLNAHYPVAAVHAIVGRCHAREKVVASTALNLVKTYQDSSAVGGSGTGGIEKILTRGAAMSAAELASIQKVLTPAPTAQGATADAALGWDTETSAKFALLIHLNLL